MLEEFERQRTLKLLMVYLGVMMLFLVSVLAVYTGFYEQVLYVLDQLYINGVIDILAMVCLVIYGIAVLFFPLVWISHYLYDLIYPFFMTKYILKNKRKYEEEEIRLSYQYLIKKISRDDFNLKMYGIRKSKKKSKLIQEVTDKYKIVESDIIHSDEQRRKHKW